MSTHFPSLQAARDHLFQTMAVNPFKTPINPLEWNHPDLVKRSAKMEALFCESLCVLAAEGDLSSIRAFFNAPWLDLIQLNRIKGEWPQRLFREARIDILPELIDEVASTFANGPAPNADYLYHGLPWTECVGIALGRAQGDARILDAVERYFPKAAHRLHSEEYLSDLFSKSIACVAPDDFARALAKSLEVIKQSNWRLPVAVFGSRQSSNFRSFFPQTPNNLCPPEPADELMQERARRHLEWLGAVDLRDETFSPYSRLLTVSAAFSRFPALAPALAQLFAQHDALEGCPWDAEHFRALDVGRVEGGEFHIKWRHDTMSPVDQALAWGSIEGARALIQAGFQWDPDLFIDSARATLLDTDTRASHLIALPIALAERLVLEGEGSKLAPVVAKTPRI